MYKYYIIAAIAILFNLNTASAITRDSIGVENNNGKKLIIHKVIAKDTYYSIARRYHVNPKEVMTFNDSKFLQIGTIIKVPTSVPFSGNSNAAAASSITQGPVAETTNRSGQGLVEHVVQKKENLNALAEKYGTTVNEIKRINNLRTINLQIGQVLKIPVKPDENAQPEEIPAAPAASQSAYQQPVQQSAQRPGQTGQLPAGQKEIVKNIDLTNKPAGEEPVVHTVASNETIYSIATSNGLTIDQLKAKNNLTNSSLFVGQKLLIKGQYPVKPAYTADADNGIDTLNSIKDPALKYPASSYGLNQIEEKGAAVWIADPDLDSSKMFVLHRTAPIGTVIKITNPMSNRAAFAKVVGKFTENESTKDVIIVMTKAVADALGALDKRFYCNLTYGGPDNEDQ